MVRTRIHHATHNIMTADECEVQRVCHAGEEDVNLAERENALEAAQHEVFNGKRLHLSYSICSKLTYYYLISNE